MLKSFLTVCLLSSVCAHALAADSFFAAAEKGDIERVREFLSSGVAVDAKNPSGHTALMLAAARGHVELVRYLINRDAQVNMRGPSRVTSLHMAAANNQLGAVKALIKAGADVNARNDRGGTALQSAWWGKDKGRNRDIAEFLIANGAKVNDPQLVLSHLSICAAFGRREDVAWMIEKGARDGGRLPAMAAAAAVGNCDTVEFLLDRGWDANARGADGSTPLTSAAENKRGACIALLLSRGADVSARRKDGKTALDIASGEARTVLERQIAAKRASVEERPQAAPAAQLGGIGVCKQSLAEPLTFVIPGGPAARAGLRTGDRITQIDGVSIHYLGEADRSARLAGPPGTTVKLSWVVREKEFFGRYSRRTPETKDSHEELTAVVERALVDFTLCNTLAPQIVAAARGDVQAQAYLGEAYLQGRDGAPKDYAEALIWLRMAANAEKPLSEYWLGHMYENGLGVDKDPSQARLWYEKSAQHGLVDAQVRLGTIYGNGEGTERNFRAAIRWFSMAAAQNDPLAMYNMGVLSEFGDDSSAVPPDIDQAVHWFSEAAAKGHPKAATRAEQARRRKFEKQETAKLWASLKTWGGAIALIIAIFGMVAARRAWSRRTERLPRAAASDPADGRTAAPSEPQDGIATDVLASVRQQEEANTRRIQRLADPKYLDSQRTDPQASLAIVRELVALHAGRQVIEATGAVRSEDFAPTYARVFLKAGDHETALRFLERGRDPKGSDQKLYRILRTVIGQRRDGGVSSNSQIYLERLKIAQALSSEGFHDEAAGVLTESVIPFAGQDDADAYIVAQVYKAAGRTKAFCEQVARGRPAGYYRDDESWDEKDKKERSPAFFTNFARAFSILDDPQTALALLGQKKELSADDHLLRIELHGRLGTLESLDADALPKQLLPTLAQGLLDAGREEKAWSALERSTRSSWRARDYGLCLRLCQRLGRAAQADAIYQEAQGRLSVEDAPELRYYFALYAEKRGQLDRAKGIYKELLAKLGVYKDADQRLANLEAVPAEETTQLSSVLSTVAGQAAAAGGTAMPLTSLVGGRFELLLPAGIGGMGVVYKAFDRKLQRPVAVKRMRGELASDPKSKARFLEEARLQSQLRHPGIVALYDVVEDAGAVHLVFEYVDGETFGEILAARGKLSAREAARLVRPVCEALAQAHAQGVVHLDIKPSNVMRDKTGIVKVLDFGVSRQLGGGKGDGGGTPAYMAPEQTGGTLTASCDVFALGVMFYELLMGRVPFPGPDCAAQKARGLFAPLPAEVPEPLLTLVAACLQVEAQRRPQSMAEVLAALDGTLAAPVKA